MSLTVDIRKKMSGFSLEAAFGAGDERMGLLGASGCGKSLTLKCIAGIETPDSGTIVINGRTVFDSSRRINLPPQNRHTGYLFQNYALFPTMTVAGNIGITLKGITGKDRRAIVAESLGRMRLEGLADRYPAQLSGGQQQRVALARMLVSEPAIVMLDEPFSALDSFLRSQMENELYETLESYRGTVLYVSHNRDEVWRVCGRMAVLDEGRIAALGDKRDIFRNPSTVAAARLTGCKNIAPAFRSGERRISIPDWGLELATAEAVQADITHAGIRSHHIARTHAGDTSNAFSFNLERLIESPFGFSALVSAGPGRESLRWEMESADHRALPGSGTGAVSLCIPAERILLLR